MTDFVEIDRSRQPNQHGLALIAVLVALGILIGLVVPFILSMGHGQAAAIQRVDEAQAELGSASVRDLLLDRVAAGHVALDKTPQFDSGSEFPSKVELPDALSAFAENGRQLSGGEAEDVQRRINLNTASPLVLANLLGLVARLTEGCATDGERLVVDDAARLPESGVVVVDRELIRYRRRTDRELLDLERGLRADEGFAKPGDHEIATDSLVLDYRCVLAVTYPFWERHEGQRDRLVPYLAVNELTRLQTTAFGGFTLRELDVLEGACTVASVHEFGGNWGKPERVFAMSPDGVTLQVRSAAFMAGGTIVRVRKLHDPEGSGEFNLVWSVEAPPNGIGTVNLPRPWFLNLLRPLAGNYEPIDTIVEPLVPQPINVNTASREVLVAALENLRQGRRVRPASSKGEQKPGEEVHGQPQRAAQFGPPIARARAEEIVDRIWQVGGRNLSGDEAAASQRDGIGPFQSFADFEKRVMKPLLNEVKGTATQQLMLVYQNALSGRDGALEMGTVPFTFSSAPVVSYRAAMSRNRVAGQVAARHERQGTALVVPSRALDLVQATQEAFEDAFRLDRRSPFFTTYPINVGALIGGDRGTDPASRHVAHLLADAYPELGFGQARFPSPDGNGSGFKPAPASTPLSLRFSVHEDMAMSLDPEGRNVGKEGAYDMENTGPQGRGGQPSGGSNKHDKRSFPFTTTSGVAPTGIAFWFRLDDTAPQALFDFAADHATRDRIKLSLKDGYLHLKVFDTAGADPDGQPIDTAPELCAGQWKIPLAGEDGFKIDAKTWYHVSFSAHGNRPGQIALLVDGVPRGEAEFRTYLTEDLPPFTPDRTGKPFNQDTQRFLSCAVESTKGFPDAGVVRIGLELFEYSSKDEKHFYADYKNSRGGRLARMDAAEFRPDLPVDKKGKPTKSIEDLAQAADTTPKHQSGAAVELYGYSIPIYRNAIWYPGTARLAEGVGAFSVARMINTQRPISIQIVFRGRPIQIPIGTGLDDTHDDDILLGNPQVDLTRPDPIPAEDRILAGFPASGGFALLVQIDRSRIAGQDTLVGGLELIRYGKRENNKLTGVKRAQTLPGVEPDGRLGWTGAKRRFVGVWDPGVYTGTPENKLFKLKRWQSYVVPISLPVTGPVADPRTSGWTEWVQLYDKGDENKTEWVRYDVRDGQHVVRARAAAFRRVHDAITNQQNTSEGAGSSGGVNWQDYTTDVVYPPPPQGLINIGIGSIEQLEYDHPMIWAVRRALNFRGDWGTSCRAQGANVEVMPVQRAELDWGNYGALSGRVGRNDRIALIEGSAGPGGATRWHTVNWAARRFGFDNPQVTTPGAEKLGPYPFQLVGLKSAVSGAFTGPAERDDARDARLLDRIVKFPSGELPAAYPDRANFGGSTARDDPQMRGTIDELTALSHRVPSLILDSDMSATAQDIVVRDDATVESFGVVVRAGVMNEVPRNGAMVMIDGELIACESFNGGTIRVARKGRGKLATKPRAHDEGTLVHVLDQVPVAILAGTINENSHQFPTNGLGALPRFGGTVLLGSELLHYTWTLGDQLLEMPSYVDATSESKAKRGLFRGRYGTNPYSAQSGEPLIGFPFRVWDRYRERTEDPELSYFQTTYHQGSAYFTELMWREDNDEPKLVDLQCLVRVDGKGGFADDPSAGPSLRKFEQGTIDDHGNRINRQAETLEARFFVTYKSGAFDPFTFLTHGWKKAPTVTGVVLSFEGEPRILEERVTAR